MVPKYIRAVIPLTIEEYHFHPPVIGEPVLYKGHMYYIADKFRYNDREQLLTVHLAPLREAFPPEQTKPPL